MADESATAERVTVVFVDRTMNSGAVPITNVRLALLCPPDTPAQTVNSLELEPEPDAVETDHYGQRVARFGRGQLGPGQQWVVRSITDATLTPWQVDLGAYRAPTAPQIPDEIRALYLRDGERYALDADRVRQAAREVRSAAGAAAQPDPLAIIGAAFDYVVEHVQYSRDGTWDPADKVLQRGTGSCSEYTFAFVALCRANGVPARYAGGHARRAGAALYIDRISHRWAEAYIPDLGWVPFDPTRSDGKDRHRRYFGRSPRDVLTLARGDGGPDSAVQWRYDSYHTWVGPGDGIGVHRRAWWFPPVPDEIRFRVAAFASALPHASSRAAKERLILTARTIGHPFTLPWLEDLLYDAHIRVKAAEAVRDIGGPQAIVAVIDCLGRAGDPAGDRAIGALLDVWTGERIASSRIGWQAWLNTKAFAAFTSIKPAEVER